MKLEEVRRMLERAKVPKAEKPKKKPVDEHKAKVWHLSSHFTVLEDDLIFLFGKYKTKRISQVVQSMEGVSYIRWMLRQDFLSGPAKEEVRKYLEGAK